MTDSLSNRPAPAVQIGERLMSSGAFKSLFREGMGLVEQTASYLDGQGRTDARGLDRAGSLAYATQSMRLTTRLMQLASWLLLQRAVNEGEMSREQAEKEKARVSIRSDVPEPDDSTLGLLPAPLADLIDQSVRLQLRLRRLEDVLANPDAAVPEQDNVVGRQHDLLRQAFVGRF